MLINYYLMTSHDISELLAGTNHIFCGNYTMTNVINCLACQPVKVPLWHFTMKLMSYVNDKKRNIKKLWKTSIFYFLNVKIFTIYILIKILHLVD